MGTTVVGASVALSPLGDAAASAAPTERLAKQPEASDADLDALLIQLDSLPPELKEADPKTYPDYEQQLTKSLSAPSKKPSGVEAASFKPGKCLAEVAPLVIEYGIPVGKVIGWIRRARQLWGGVKGIWTAIRSGVAASELGEDAVKVLEGLLGVGGVITACSL